MFYGFSLMSRMLDRIVIIIYIFLNKLLMPHTLNNFPSLQSHTHQTKHGQRLLP